MSALAVRPLPGIRFEQVGRPAGNDLPRMDVPVFIGFASKGDIHEPVAIEDVDAFLDTFGEDAALAWDVVRSRAVTSYLGPAVRAFFANGGRRCWVVRIAGPGTSWETMGPDLFLDPALRDSRAEGLLAEADYVRYQAAKPRTLRGIHAALSLDEASLVAVPDLALLGLGLQPVDGMSPPVPIMEPDSPSPAGFQCCEIETLDVPTLEAIRSESEPDEWSVTWSEPAVGGVETEIEVRAGAEDASPALVVRATAQPLLPRGLPPGDLWLRARRVDGYRLGAWSGTMHLAGPAARASATPVVPVGVLTAAAMDAPRSQAVRAVQRALLAMCTARGDLFAVLSIPYQVREDESVSYVRRLRNGEGNGTPELPAHESSFGALYHPWLVDTVSATRGDLPAQPPDGAVCGLYARRARSRGAWIAPANEPLMGVVALAPPMARPSWQLLQDEHLNVIRQEPRGFLALSADTLTDDPELRPIGVRRLLALLRKLAADRGMPHVFEPYDALFRRRVQDDFTSLLTDLFRRGAFAGNAPAEAFRVVTDDTVNPPQAVDLGRFVIELRVAPSHPLRFLLVRLVHAPDQLLAVEEA